VSDPAGGSDPTRFLPPLRGDLAAAKEVELDEDEDFTAEHVALVVPQVDHQASRHLKRLVVGWGMLADFAFSDLLLYVAVPDHDEGRNRYLVANQVRPNTGQTLFVDDVVGRLVDDHQRPLVARATATGEITTGEVDSAWLGQRIRVTAVPVVFGGRVIGIMAKETAMTLPRSFGDLARNYLEVFDQLARMVARGEYPFTDEEALSAGAPRVGDGVLRVDARGRVSFASPNAVSAIRRLGGGAFMGEPAVDLPQIGALVRRASMSRQPAIAEYEHEESVVVARCIPLLDHRRIDGLVLLMRDVSELRSRDRLLISKDATIREIHHRVKNNLQTISSLLRLQGRRLTEPTAKAAIEESVRRIASIALVHETLSRTAEDEVDLLDVARPLVRMVEEGLTSPDRPVRFELEGAPGRLGSAEVTSLAVILTELLQNVMDHAYPPDSPAAGGGTVRIELSRNPTGITLVVEDDGVGPAAEADGPPTSSLGLSIVRGLVSDLQGTISFGPGSGGPGRVGTRVEISVPVLPTA
jgi:two-component sensor histidine kinase